MTITPERKGRGLDYLALCSTYRPWRARLLTPLLPPPPTYTKDDGQYCNQPMQAGARSLRLP